MVRVEIEQKTKSIALLLEIKYRRKMHIMNNKILSAAYRSEAKEDANSNHIEITIKYFTKSLIEKMCT